MLPSTAEALHRDDPCTSLHWKGRENMFLIVNLCLLSLGGD